MSATAIAKEKIDLAVGDGTRMEAYVARPEQGGPHVTEALAAQQKIYVNAEFSRADHGFFAMNRQRMSRTRRGRLGR